MPREEAELRGVGEASSAQRRKNPSLIPIAPHQGVPTQDCHKY